MNRPTPRWTRYQQEVVDYLARRFGAPTQRRANSKNEAPRPARFDTRLLAAKLAQALRQETP